MVKKITGRHIRITPNKDAIRTFIKSLEINKKFIILDIALLIATLFLAFTFAKVLFFHLVFIFLTFGAFYWKFRAFAARAIFWVAVTTGLVLIAILASEIQPVEIIEIPLLTSILILVFAIAQQRSSAEEALRTTNEELEQRIAMRTVELTRGNTNLTREVAERKRAEATLRESEERYRQLVELSFEAIMIHSQGKVVYINGPGVELLGATHAAELVGQPIRNFVHPDYVGQVQTRVERLTSGEKGVPLLEEKFIRLDGTALDVEVAAVAITYQGQPAIQTVIRNITARKQIEQELRQIAAKNQALLDAIPDSMFYLSRDGQLLDYKIQNNNLLPGILAQPNHEMNPTESLHPTSELADLTLHYLHKTLDSGDMQVIEYQLPHDPRHFEARLVVSGPKEVLAIVSDVTERKERADAVEKERARFARDLHDSLGQNLGYLRLKLDELTLADVRPDKDKIRQELVRLRDVTNEAYELVRRMLAAAKFSNSADLAKELLAQTKVVGDRAGFAVQLISDGQPRILSPIVQQQVLYIFKEALSNVAKHARARHVDLNISWTEDLLIITLSDNGCGFDPDAVRAEGHYGLMIMQERANEIDAFLSISSQLKTGTVLMLQLPYASSALPLAS